MGGIRQVIAKNGDDGKESIRDRTVELSRDWWLGDEDDWICERECLGAESDPHRQHRSRKPNQTQPISKYHGVSLALLSPNAQYADRRSVNDLGFNVQRGSITTDSTSWRQLSACRCRRKRYPAGRRGSFAEELGGVVKLKNRYRLTKFIIKKTF